MEITLIPCGEPYLDPFRALYEDAFPEGERKAFDYLLTKQSERVYDLWTVVDKTRAFVGLVTAVRYQDYVLLDYLAICPTVRGQGIGHRVLEAVRQQYRGAHLFLEIEVPCAAAENAAQRERRLAFYLDAGLVRTGVRAHIYGDEMELLAYPEDVAAISFSLYRDMLTATFPASMIPKP